MLTLILQTQEGHQIELNVQPDDTFADLKSQYSDTEILGLSDSLEQLITNGTSVAENTKIFDYITGTAQEWFCADTAEDSDISESVKIEKNIKECCTRGCSNNELTTPGKPFFPLPTDHERLSLCLIEIGRPDLYDQFFRPGTENCQKYFLCNSHYNEEAFSSSSHSTMERSSTISFLKPKNDDSRSKVIEETISIKEKQEVETFNDKFQQVDVETEKAILEPLCAVRSFEHPGIFCRLCGEIATNPIPLYAHEAENLQEEFSLADKINLCLPVTVTMTDPLPKQICQNCRVKLDVCHDLALLSLHAEDKLSLLLRENKLCSDANGTQNCPLCVKGDMSIVKKSGLYRKNELKNDFFCKKIVKEIGSSSEDVKNSSSSTEVHQPIVDESIYESTTIEAVPESQLTDENDTLPEPHLTDENDTLPLPVGEFSCSICSTVLVNVASIETHVCPQKTRLSPYSCVICEKSNFTSPHELQLHYRHHGICTGKFTDKSPRSADQNFSKMTNKTRIDYWKIRCEICQRIFPSEESSRNHDCCQMTSEMSDKSYVEPKIIERSPKLFLKKPTVRYNCHFCQRQFTRKGSLEKHMKLLHSDRLDDESSSRCYKCKNCCEAFAHETEVLDHFSLKHQESSSNNCLNFEHELFTEKLFIASLYVCEFCERCFTIPSSLHEHREIEHEMNLKYSCTICNLTFDSHRQLANHKSLHSHAKPLEDLAIKRFYVCKYCDKTFLHFSSYSSHVTQHQDITMPYLCRLCNVSFESYSAIALHRDIAHPYCSTLHERSSRTYDCQYCEKKFNQEIALVKHIRMHTGERPYKCPICGKGFSQSSGLNTHVRIHSDLRPFACTKCPRTFKIKGDRDNHVKRHAGNRPYKCEFCTKAFMTQHVYSQHRKIHTNERPYKCEVCSQAFRRSHVLTVHMRRHTGEKPHECDLCPKRYRQRGDLLKHRKMQHGMSGNSTSVLEIATHDEESCDIFGKTSDNLSDDCNSLILPL